MKTQKEHIKEQKPVVLQKKSAPDTGGTANIEDKRSSTVHQRKLRETINASAAGKAAPVQRKKNNTGLPDTLKTGIENLSGYAMDDVKVHYNSSKPAQLQAHAYAQGTDIHLAPGQEKHLPHEAWHVVQQKQGRVKPTRQLKSKVNINDDTGLEKEADVMGAKTVSLGDGVQRKDLSAGAGKAEKVVQRQIDPTLATAHTDLASAVLEEMIRDKPAVEGTTYIIPTQRIRTDLMNVIRETINTESRSAQVHTTLQSLITQVRATLNPLTLSGKLSNRMGKHEPYGIQGNTNDILMVTAKPKDSIKLREKSYRWFEGGRYRGNEYQLTPTPASIVHRWGLDPVDNGEELRQGFILPLLNGEDYHGTQMTLTRITPQLDSWATDTDGGLAKLNRLKTGLSTFLRFQPQVRDFQFWILNDGTFFMVDVKSVEARRGANTHTVIEELQGEVNTRIAQIENEV